MPCESAEEKSMKKIERKVANEHIYVDYEATDGTVFTGDNAQRECELYEKTFQCAIKARLKQIAIIVQTEDALLDGSCETTMYVVQPKTDADIFVIQQALSINSSNNASRVSNDDIGRVLLVGFTYDDDYVFVMKLDQIVENITDGKWEVVEKKDK